MSDKSLQRLVIATSVACGAVFGAGLIRTLDLVLSRPKPNRLHAREHSSKAPKSPNEHASLSHTGFATRAIHVGNEPEPETGAVTVPISLATTFAQVTPGIPCGKNDLNSHGRGYEYSRTGNPTRGAFERCIAACENANGAIAYSSGSAGIAAIIHLLKQGDHVVSIDDVYGGTQRYFRRVVHPIYGIDFTFVDLANTENLRKSITPNTKMVWLESPTNPLLKVCDIQALCEIAHEHGCIVVVDNTFLSPYFQNPISLGADIVLHSITKYIGGHSDVVMGVVCTSNSEIETQLRFIQNSLGACPSPFDCYLALRGMKTLHLRMQEHERNAFRVAEFLESHPLVRKVHYPGLRSHPQHNIAKKQQSGFGGMITFWLKDDSAIAAETFLSSLQFFTLAESLGAVESLAECPALMTHLSVPEEERKKLGISNSLIRLSVGIENIEDLLGDITNAFDAVKSVLK